MSNYQKQKLWKQYEEPALFYENITPLEVDEAEQVVRNKLL